MATEVLVRLRFEGLPPSNLESDLEYVLECVAEILEVEEV